MRNAGILFLAWLVYAVSGTVAFGQIQGNDKITASFTGASFLEFVRQAEAQTTYRFFFNPTEVDSLQVTVQAAQAPLPEVLAQIFRNTPYQFAIDQHRHVYVVKGNLQTDLPPGFFARDDKDLAPTAGQLATGPAREQIGDNNRLYEIGLKTNALKAGTATISGKVIDGRNNQPIIGALVMIENPLTAVATDQNGAYALTLPTGRHELKIKSVGMREVRRQVMLYADGRLTIPLQEQLVSLGEVLVTGNKDQNIVNASMGVEKLDIRTIKQVPTAFGEADVLKVVLTLPGVKSVGESSTGLNVRGGATDQNLILFNEAVIFNPAHLFGFFSAFNPDVIKEVELYKNSIPVNYGGRLASVLRVTSREGNPEKVSGAGGLGLISSRLMLEGPIVKNKTTFLVAGRSTYSDWLLQKMPSESLQQSKASFYDANATIAHQIDSSSSLSLHGYRSQDVFRFGIDTLYVYQNQSAILTWKKAFSDKLSTETSGAFTQYGYSVASERNPATAFDLAYRQRQWVGKLDFTYRANDRHTLLFGGTSQLHQIRPGDFTPRGDASLVSPKQVAQEQALESALYLGDQFDISPAFSVSVGLRYSFYQYLGAKDVITYQPGQTRREASMVDTLSFASGKTIKTYHGPEYRITARYSLNEKTSIKAGYNRNRQYLHMLTNTAMMSPTDIWKLSDTYLRPQIGEQWSMGLFRNFRSNTVETSLEVYYKTMQHLLDYKSGAELLLNQHIETDVINSRGKAYGVEVMARKTTGKLNGWVSYTYSRSLIQSDDEPYVEKINRGNFYPSNFDKPHDFTMVGNFRVNRRFSTSLNLTYSTGRPITLPMALYEVGGAKRIFYSERNQYRIPDYYRADVALNIEGGHKIKKLAHSSWTLAVYNLTGRRNPYSVFFKAEQGAIKGYQLSVFGQPIPTVTYNFKF